MIKHLIFLLFCIFGSINLSGCHVDSTRIPTQMRIETTIVPPRLSTASTALETPATAVSSETLSITIGHPTGAILITPTSQAYTTTPASITQPSTPTFPSYPLAILPPPFLYIYGSTIIEQIDNQEQRRIADLPENGKILSATLLEDQVLILREDGLQSLKLLDNSIQWIQRFNQRGLFGMSMPARGRNQAIYAAMVDDREALFGIGTNLGLFDGESHTLQVTRSISQTVEPLGLSADGRSLYFLPRGQDPDFRTIRILGLESGQVEAEIPVEGYQFAALSPDGRYLATASEHSNSSGTIPEGVINLYRIDQNVIVPKAISLPEQPRIIGGLIWSPDSQWLYILLDPNDLWRLEVAMQKFDPIASLERYYTHTISISPDGKWLLLRPISGDNAILVHLPTGDIAPFHLPVDAVIVGWRQPVQ